MPYYIKDPKRDHDFDNHPYKSSTEGIPALFVLNSVSNFLGITLQQYTNVVAVAMNIGSKRQLSHAI